MLIVAMFYKQNHYEIIEGSLSDEPIESYYQTRSVFSGCGRQEFSVKARKTQRTFHCQKFPSGEDRERNRATK